MKLVNVTGSFLILVLTFPVMCGSLYAQSETSIIKSFRDNAAGIATSSLSVRQIKEKLLKLRSDSPSLSSNEASFNPVRKKIESK
ncbi:MAG: hypothetical protein MRJ52_10070 [Nitrosomonas sp.]|jgi:hypothetical protein|nr:hypothetical protein [Nitrosomonas sp.]